MLPGKPTHFTVDSTATGDAPVDVSIAANGKNVARKPTVVKKSDGIHDVTYVPPPVGDPYDVSEGSVVNAINAYLSEFPTVESYDNHKPNL